MLCIQALVALRDYLPHHIYHHASNHLFSVDELKAATLMPRLRPEFSNIRAYAAGNIEVVGTGILPTLPSLHHLLNR